MTLFAHVVTLEPVPRRWFDQGVSMLHETAESLRPEGDGLVTEDGRTVSTVRLIEGRHAHPGARYVLADGSGNAVVTAWNPRTETAGQVEIDDDEMYTACEGALRPNRLNAAGVMVIKQYKRLSGLSWSGAAELDRWWAGGRGAAPITASAKHMFGVARATISQRPTAEGRWEVEVAVKLRGRSVFWPFVALAMLFARGKVQGSINEAVETFAAKWNADIPPLLRKSSDELRAMLIDAIVDESSSRKAG
ncbi:MAG: hypothetical protein QOF58_6855 [Pseudonocardiales bacterium]|jgi:hypothetical protein|nr:hypothetical protein [Pseudonocardiales bacterium]